MSGDFALTHAPEKCQFDRLLLSGRQAFDYVTDQFSGVREFNFLFRRVMDPRIGLLFGLLLQTFTRACVSLLLAQPIDGSASGEGDHPAQWFPFLSGEILRLIPQLHENFLKEVVRLSFVMDDAKDEGFDDPVITIVKLG